MTTIRNEAARREKLSALRENEKLDGYLILDPINVSYLTGFNGEDAALWLGDAGAVLLSDSRFAIQIAQEAPDLVASIRNSGETSFGLLEKAFADSRFSSTRPKRIGFEAESTTVAVLETMKRQFPDVEFVPRFNDVEKMREIKDASEIAAIRVAIDLSIAGMRALRSALEPDATEADVRDELDYRMRKLGADDVAFPTIVAFDERAALPHAIPTRSRRVRDASLILIDWGAKKNGYVGDLTRTFRTPKGLEAPKDSEFATKYRQVFDVVHAARDAALVELKPGALCSRVDAAARKTIADAGFGAYFGHGLGHGIGRVVHDFGRLSPKNDVPLVPGTITTVEPGIYLPNWGGIRLEDDVLITDNGAEILSSNLKINLDEE